MPSTSSRGSGPASAGCSPSSPTWPAVAGVGAARRRARPAAAAGRRRPGARSARGRGQQAAGSGRPVPSTSSRGSGPALARCSPGSLAWPAGRRGRGCPAPGASSSGSGSGPARCSPSSRTWLAGCCRPRGSESPGAGYIQQRQRPAPADIRGMNAPVWCNSSKYPYHVLVSFRAFSPPLLSAKAVELWKSSKIRAKLLI